MSFRTGVLIIRVRDVVNPNHDIPMNQTARPIVSRRQKAVGPDHHLWNNNGTWWLHCTIHLPDFTKCRLRRNLRTSDLQTAQHLRDRILTGNPPTSAHET